MNYNQDFEAAKNWYKIAKEQNNQQSIDILEQLFPKLKDIYIVDTLVSICNMALPDIFKKCGCDKDDVLEWLNSQYDKNMSLTDILNNDIPKRQATGVLKEMIDEANNTAYKPKFSKGDYIIRNTDGYIHNTYYIKDVMNDYYVCTELSENYNITFSFEEADNTFKLWDISDAKDGDILAEDSCLFIIKKLNDDFSADTYCVLYDDGDYENNCHLYFDYKGTYPATKEQREELFNRITMEKYEWDPENKELKNIKPKFNEGDWVVDEEDNSAHQIKQVIENVTYGGFSYDLTDNGYFPYAKSNYHLWTIKDAKDSDVLSNGKMIVIFKHFEEPSYKQHIVAYIGLDNNGDIQITNGTWNLGIDKVKPATKEQQDLLFQKMNEAGYKWDEQNKKVIKYITHKFNVGDSIQYKNAPEKIYNIVGIREIYGTYYYIIDDDGGHGPWDIAHTDANFELANKNNFVITNKNDKNEEDPSLFDNYDPYKAAVQHILETCYEYEDVINPDTYAAEFYDEIIAKCNNAIEYDNKYPKKKSLNVEDLTNIQSITKILNNAKKYYCDDNEIVRGIEWVNSFKNL